MTIPSREPKQIDVKSLVTALAKKGFTSEQITTRLDEYGLSTPDFPGEERTAASVMSEIEPAVRESVRALGRNPSVDEVAWILNETARAVGDPILASVILEAGEAPSPSTSPRGIHPQAVKVWKKMFKEHGDEIAKAKKIKQWGVAVAIFKNMAKKEGLEPFIKKSAWTETSMEREDLGQTIRELTLLAENMEILGYNSLAFEIDIVTNSLEERFEKEEISAALYSYKERLAATNRAVEPMSFQDFRVLLAQILDEAQTRDFKPLFELVAKNLRKTSSHKYMGELKKVYDNYVMTFYDVYDSQKATPSEFMEEELFGYFLSIVDQALLAVLLPFSKSNHHLKMPLLPLNEKKLHHYLISGRVGRLAQKVLSRSQFWRNQFGL